MRAGRRLCRRPDQRTAVVRQYHLGTLADPAAGWRGVPDGLRCQVPRPDPRLHVRGRRVRPAPAGHAYRPGPVPDGNHLHLAARKRVQHSDDAAQPRRAGRVRQGRRTDDGGGNTPREREGPGPAQANRGVAAGLTRQLDRRTSRFVRWRVGGRADRTPRTAQRRGSQQSWRSCPHRSPRP